MTKSVKNINEVRIPAAYELIGVNELPENKSLGIYLKHKKSGAKLALISNEDKNKVFCIGFRTPPEDSTGVAHIVEHTTLCGSKKYPSKDPFVELVKGSLNTFLNAMTYPDKTVYPVASENDKDFANLMGVYLDAVFYPNFYRNKAIFEQEGWHYELDPETGKLTYNGVVYNEMKGSFSSPDTIEWNDISAELYPDVTYHFVSGGDPEVIPTLTYENYLAFHKRFYHPSNSYIYLYGDFDIEDRLDFLDKEYLSAFDAINPKSEIPLQKPVKADKTYTYSLSDGEDSDHRTFLSYSTVTGLSTDVMHANAMKILEYVMVDAPGAPIKKALVDAGIGNDISSSFVTDSRQTALIIEAAGANAEDKDKFVSVIEDTAKKYIEQGISKKSLTASLNFFEFKYREGDFGRWPKGLLVGLRMYDSWLYDETKPFDTIELGGIFAELRKKIDTDYFEKLLDSALLHNDHKVILTVAPEKGKNAALEKATEEKLAKIKASMTEKDIEDLKAESAKLKAFQETPSTPEELAAIPMLDREDIAKKPKTVSNIDKEINGIKTLWHKEDTNGIAYLHLLFDANDMAEEDLQYMRLLADTLGLVDTKKHTYADLSDEVLMYSGGIMPDLNYYSNVDDANKVGVYFGAELKTLARELPHSLPLLNEILYETEFTDATDKRVKEILKENIAGAQSSLEGNGNANAVSAGAYYLTAMGRVGELVNGISYYRFIKDLSDNYESKKDALHKKLNGLLKKYIVKERAFISVTADEASFTEVANKGDLLVDIMPTGSPVSSDKLSDRLVNEIAAERKGWSKKAIAYTGSGTVQYVARVGNFREKGLPYTGLLELMKVMLSYDYLWMNVRVKGGAYGCYGGFDRDGRGSFSSYRDPNLFETDKVYEGVADYLESFKADDRTLTQFIIGTMSAVDRPLNPYASGEKALVWKMRGVSYEDAEKARDEILSVTEEGIHSLAPYAKALMDDNVLAVVGSEAKINENRDKFDKVESLL